MCCDGRDDQDPRRSRLLQPTPHRWRLRYANICEQCDNYVPDPTRHDVIESQLADVIELRADAEHRGWTDERTRHQHVVDALTNHLRTIKNPPPAATSS